jgi:hypothetical protein
MESQKHLAAGFPAEQLSFNEEMAQIKEFINVGEAGPAYEVIVATLEQAPFAISGSAAAALLELGLLFRYRTDRPEDRWLQEQSLCILCVMPLVPSKTNTRLLRAACRVS